jgi:hypothetical protein
VPNRPDELGGGVQRQQLGAVAIERVRGDARQHVLRPGQHGSLLQCIHEFATSGDSKRVPITQERLECRSMLGPSGHKLHGLSLAQWALVPNAIELAVPSG